MIDPRVLSASSGEGTIVIDHMGEPLALRWLSADVPTPALLVGNVNEAIKQADAGRVVDHLDRDELWLVEGFVLDAEVLNAIPEGECSAHDLMAAVVAAGYQWRVVEIPADPDLSRTDPL